jgi:hypothetical protein
MQLNADWNSGGAALIEGAQQPSLKTLLNPAMGITLAQLKAHSARHADQLARVVDAGRAEEEYAFRSASVLTGDDKLVIAPTVGTGRWVRKPGQALIVCPFGFATADNAPLLVTPAGCYWRLNFIHWLVSVGFTGGASSAIGVTSSKTNFTSNGALLGGAGGDVAATLVASAAPIFGTIGADFDTLAKQRSAVFGPADEIRLKRIVSAFTAGAGSVVLDVTILQNAGA